MRSSAHFHRLIAPALASAMILSLATPVRAQLAASPWPKFQHDAQNTGQSEFNGPASVPSVLWEHVSRAPRRCAPSIAADGTIYTGNARRPMTALDPNTGAEIWSTTKGNASTAERSSPAVKADGTLYFGARDNDLWSVSPNGSVNWRFMVHTDGDVSTSPAIGNDGTVFMGSDSLGAGRFYGLNPDGTQKWLNVLGVAAKNVGPALSHDGSKVFVSAAGRQVIALTASTGAEIWRTPLSAISVGSRAPNFSPVVGPDDTVYFATRAGVFALSSASGTVLWSFTPPGQNFFSAPALSNDGTLYVGAAGIPNTFYAINSADGTVKWTYVMPSGPGFFRNNQAAVGANGTVYVGFHRKIFAFDGGGDGMGHGQVLWSKDLPAGIIGAGPVIPGPGRLYVDAGRSLYALAG